MKNQKIYRILIFEPSEIVSEGLQNLLNQIPQMQIIRSYSDLSNFQESLLRNTPDIIIINTSLIGHNGWNEIKSVVTDELIAGVQYQATTPEVIKGFNIVIDIFDNPKIIKQKLDSALLIDRNNESSIDTEELSEREKEILTAVARGMMNKEIAEKFYISIHTVISHRKNITRKTGIKSVAGLTVYALLNNLIDDKDIQ